MLWAARREGRRERAYEIWQALDLVASGKRDDPCWRLFVDKVLAGVPII